MLKSRNNQPLPGWRRPAFLGYVAVMLMVFLLPMPVTPPPEATQVDKLGHFVMFTGFALLFWMDQQRSAFWTFLISSAFAGAIELVQATLPHRHGDWMDFAAGAAGAGLGTILVPWIVRQAGWVGANGVESHEES